MRKGVSMTTDEVGKVDAGELVLVKDTHCVEAEKGWTVFAFVTRADGVEGWVRCASKDGTDLIDTRDQLEFEKVTSQLREEKQRSEAVKQDRVALLNKEDTPASDESSEAKKEGESSSSSDCSSSENEVVSDGWSTLEASEDQKEPTGLPKTGAANLTDHEAQDASHWKIGPLENDNDDEFDKKMEALEMVSRPDSKMLMEDSRQDGASIPCWLNCGGCGTKPPGKK